MGGVAEGDGGATWNAQSSGTTERLTAVAFSDATHGWTVGEGGIILATKNGGSTWGSQSSGIGAALLAVAFSDAAHGWVVGIDGVILVTTNGGASWGLQSSGSSDYLTGVTFGDAAHGWVVGIDGVILVTANGGFPPAPAAAPRITKREPASAKRGALVSITGTDFGVAPGTSSVKFGSKTCTTYLSWSNGQITCKVPKTAKFGVVKVTVTTAAGTSNAKRFTVKR